MAPKFTLITPSPLSDYDLGFFVCGVEGEGGISIHFDGKTWHPKIRLSNTDVGLYKEFKRLSDALVGSKSKCYVTYKERGRYKPLYNVVIGGIKNVLPILQIIEPKLVSRKKRVAELVIQYCESRLKHRGINAPYTQEELDIIKNIHDLNGRKNQSVLWPRIRI